MTGGAAAAGQHRGGAGIPELECKQAVRLPLESTSRLPLGNITVAQAFLSSGARVQLGKFVAENCNVLRQPNARRLTLPAVKRMIVRRADVGVSLQQL